MSNNKLENLRLDNKESLSRQNKPKNKEAKKIPSRDSSTCKSPISADGEKKLPPIKAPVGLAKGPDLKNVKSKIGSFANVKHKPTGGEKKVVTQKLEWNAKPRIGSLENSKYKPGGGDVKVQTQKLEWKGQPRIGSLSNVTHKPGGGAIKIFDEKYARSIGSASPANMRSPSPATSSKSLTHATTPTPSANPIDGSDEPFHPEQNGDKANNINTTIDKIKDLNVNDHQGQGDSKMPTNGH